MRKTSHDGGDSTSITSGFENEIRKTSVGIIKTKRNSIKRKVQNFSHESDDTVIEPLLQIDKTETINKSAKYLLSKSKTDSLNERESTIYSDKKLEKYSMSKPVCSTVITSNSNINLHNHMNTNVFGSHDGSKALSTVKSPVLVEINGSKGTGNLNQGSSIFTTAKIHADSITKTMAPMQVTPLPILSTVEGPVVKAAVKPDHTQSQKVEPSTSSNISKSINFNSKLEIGKSDLGTEKNKTAIFSSTSLQKSTTSESKVLNKYYDTQNVIVTSTIKLKDIENTNKSIQQPQSSIISISEKKEKSQEQRNNLDSSESFRISNAETKNEIKDDVGLQKKCSVKTIVLKDTGTTKKETKSFGSSSGSSKQLQRQKNTMEDDPRDVDVHLKNVSEINKPSSSTYKESLQKKEFTVTADVEKKQSSVVIAVTKSKDNGTQSTVLKLEPVTGSKTAEKSNKIGAPVINTTSLIPHTSKELPKSSDQSIPTGSVPLQSRLIEPKIFSETPVNKKASTIEKIVKPTGSGEPPHIKTSLRSDASKHFDGSSSISIKSVTDSSSLCTRVDDKIISKPAVVVQPKQATATCKLDSLNKDKPSDSSLIHKLDKESSSVTTTISKDVAVKSSAVDKPSKSSNKNECDSSKGKKQESDSIVKEVDRVPPTTGLGKSPITTSSNVSTKVTVTKRLPTPLIPKSVETSIHKEVVSAIDSQPHRSVLTTSTSSVAKTETICKPSVSIPSCTNVAAVTSKAELSNKVLSTATTIPSSNSTTSTLAKSPTLTCQSSTSKSTDKHLKQLR